LFWSPFVDSDDVTVSVEAGVATLTGSVDSLGEYNAARENAFEGGAITVINKLELD
jgi:osmotically-inducible protein OsmY